jgi:hypothetical protein
VDPRRRHRPRLRIDVQRLRELLVPVPIFHVMRSFRHLIVNGGGEAAPGSPDGKPVLTPGWTSTGEATAIQYGASGGYPKVTDPGPTDRGMSFLGGGPNAPASSLAQTIDVKRCGAAIDTGTISYALSGWLDGWQGQDDHTIVTVDFQDATGSTLGTASIGPVLAADRSNDTGLFQRSTGSRVPKGKRTLQVAVAMTRTEGSSNDGYLDNLSLVFNEGGAAGDDGGARTKVGPSTRRSRTAARRPMPPPFHWD